MLSCFFFANIGFLFKSFFNFINSLVDIKEGYLGVSFFFILSGFVFSFQRGKMSKILILKFFVYLREMSFAFYIVHQLVVRVLWMITNKINIPISGWILICVALSLLISHFTYKYFKKPLNYFLRQKFIIK